MSRFKTTNFKNTKEFIKIYKKERRSNEKKIC